MLFSKTRLAQVAAFAYFSVTASAASLKSRATTCNGHAELCDRGFGNVSFVGAHDSYAIGVNNLAVNQDQDITTQLNDGIRMLQMQVHDNNGALQLCHTSCLLYNGGTLQDYLKKVKSWMDANPNEVLSLLIVNIENLPASRYDTDFKAAGLDTLSFVPQSSPTPASGWPTLGNMIDTGKRLVTFLDNGADASVPYLIDEFTNIWETEFNVVTTFDCEVNRTKGDTSTQMYLINHFLDKLLLGNPVPDVDKANTTNGVSGPNSLGDHVQLCTTQHGRPPNFLLVDFYNHGGGSVFQVAANINGVTYNPSKPVAPPASASGGSSASGGASNPSSSSGNGALSVAPLGLGRAHLVGGLAVAAGIALGAATVL
ncbi:hypothetical protein HGRIS_008171 [Hohenbuehelia grisea]|uniref:PLC-like phosphodiesterase n=1 Tax=Hohenbuehelia grisea TaxID=104357 RepID=A0ABR3J767_9AGAR